MKNLEIFRKSIVWVNFFAKTKTEKFISGHDEKGNEFVLSSTGDLYRYAFYVSGSIWLSNSANYKLAEKQIQLYELITINNEDTSLPAPSEQISDRLREFERL